MRLTEYLTEASSQYGLVISKTKSGKFEDIDFYDMTEDKLATGKGHAHDLFDAFVSSVKENDGWKELESFVKKKASGKTLGDDYSDDTNFTNTLYGPFSIVQLGQLSDDFEEMYADD